MAYPLQSPGVDVTVIDESFYASAGQGTVPLFIIGTREYKPQPGGSTLAVGTLPENANTLYLISSQRELTQTFGNPIFYPQDAHELSEYGLHAAYQFLAQSNSAYVVRGGIDYKELEPSATEPVGEPLGGTYWLNTAGSTWGVFQSNGSRELGNAWVSKKPTVLADPTQLVYTLIGNHTNASGMTDPTTTVITANGHLVINGHSITLSVGTRLLGDNQHQGVVDQINSTIGTVNGLSAAYVIGLKGKAYIMLVDNTNVGALDLTGSDGQVLLDLGLTTGLNNNNAPVILGASLLPNPNLGNSGDFAVNTIYNNNVLFQKLVSYYKVSNNNVLSPAVWYPVGSVLWNLASPNDNALTFAPHYNIPANSKNGDVWINTTTPNRGVNIALQVYNANTGVWATVTAPAYPNDAAAIAGIGAIYLATNSTVYIQYGTDVDPTDGVSVVASYTPLIWNGSSWDSLVYQAQTDAPTTKPADGTHWYHDNFQVDIMVSTGQVWHGYKIAYPNTDPAGVILDASPPTMQSGGTPLVDNDLWINTSLATLENYPQIYRYAYTTRSWELIDNTDSVTPFGIVFGDARWNVDGSEFGSQSSSLMVSSNYVDPDAPNPLEYPQGVLLFNTRFSSRNVKVWQSTQLSGLVENTDYTQAGYTVGTATFPAVPFAGRWVSDTGEINGVPYFSRKAQRNLIVKKLKAAIEGNEDLLAETVYFSLIASPGYPELMSEMVSLNDSKKQIAFVVGDTPARLDPGPTSLINWSTNKNDAPGDGDLGLTASSPFLGIYYPWGLGTNVDGSSIVVPPSTMALRTIGRSDNMSYVWYTPAGYTRGLVDNATSVGYINPVTGLYKPVILSPGQRDRLYQNKINSIAFMPGRGLVIMGDRTRSPIDVAENRINVARLVNYLRYNLDLIARPFLFEPNIKHTQDSAKTIMERFLSNLVSLNALYDFIVVCDDSNNTYQRVNNNELWIDIAIQPVKTIDFIYIPLRVESKGTDLAALYAGTQGKIS